MAHPLAPTTPTSPNTVRPVLDGDSRARLAERASVLFEARELVPYPGWHFDIDWDRPDAKLQERRSIWEAFYQSEELAPIDITWQETVLRLYLGNDLSKQLFISGCFEPNEFAFLNQLLRPGMRFVDAGANEGLYSLFAAARVTESGEVWAFEPSSRELNRLKYNRSSNSFPQLTVLGCALSDHCGVATLHIAEDSHAGQNTFGPMADGVHQMGSERVPILTLDEIAEGESWEHLDVLKMDVEGAELRVLNGAKQVLRALRPLILFECSPAGPERNASTIGKLFDLIYVLDYSIYGFDLATGLPARVETTENSDNMIAAPNELTLPFRS